MSKDRGIFRMILTNFLKSFRPRQIRGNLMGKDNHGNQYFEIPKDQSIGRRRPSRWFVPQETDDFEREMPAEWEAWLRGRRDEPPTEKELLKNLAISELKKKNAAELQQKEPSGTPKPTKEDSKPFPKYEDYEDFPGKPPKR